MHTCKNNEIPMIVLEIFKINATLHMTENSNLHLLLLKMFAEAAPIVRWFTRQQESGGYFGSTQVSLPLRSKLTTHAA